MGSWLRDGLMEHQLTRWCRGLLPQFTLEQMRVLLLVATRPGSTLHDLTMLSGQAKPTVWSQVRRLGSGNRRVDGLRLIEGSSTAGFRLSTAGETLLNQGRPALRRDD